jgi:hypothetical protein
LAGQIEQHIVKFSVSERVSGHLHFHPTAADKEKERRALREWEQQSGRPLTVRNYAAIELCHVGATVGYPPGLDQSNEVLPFNEEHL